MQFLLIAHDGRDEGALNRRMAAREQHIALGDQTRANGEPPEIEHSREDPVPNGEHARDWGHLGVCRPALIMAAWAVGVYDNTT